MKESINIWHRIPVTRYNRRGNEKERIDGLEIARLTTKTHTILRCRNNNHLLMNIDYIGIPEQLEGYLVDKEQYLLSRQQQSDLTSLQLSHEHDFYWNSIHS